jgi:hypothetical protein
VGTNRLRTRKCKIRYRRKIRQNGRGLIYMSSNKKIRKQLEAIYGEGCMFEKANVEKRIEEMRGY